MQRALALVETMRRQGNEPQSLHEQVTALCQERGVMKKDISAEMGIDPSYLAQMLKRSMTARQLERLAEAINVLQPSKFKKIRPWDFDQYILVTAPALIERDMDLVRILRAYAYTMSDAQLKMWKRTCLAQIEDED